MLFRLQLEDSNSGQSEPKVELPQGPREDSTNYGMFRRTCLVGPGIPYTIDTHYIRRQLQAT